VAQHCADVSLLVNNAGIMLASTFTDAPSTGNARREMEVNYFGTLSMCRAFAPVLAASGGGAIVNMLSVVSFFTNPFNASYGASKAAVLSLTSGVRAVPRSRADLPADPGVLERRDPGPWLAPRPRRAGPRDYRIRA